MTQAVVHLPLLAPPSQPAERLLQVGELARASGKTVRAIHLYEELGLLKPDARSKGRFRLYDPSAVARVRWISKLHDLGMSLAEIQKVAETWGTAPTPARAMAEVRSIYRAKLAETRAQIAHLTALEKELETSINYLDTCDSCDEPEEPKTASADAEGCTTEPRAETPCGGCQLREREAEPDLVAGIVA
ncbi:MAG: MerR family transcriptional regulator [Polyangiaceae bacterium]|nr:MerR family transcriptional regulator [Polyangiaceae bacterium]